jgi:hypothetical protein
MTSERKIAANRNNSRRSTGPRTASGKSRVSRNAERHGLAAVLEQGPALAGELERLATAICGENAGPAARAQALAVAECQRMLSRVHVQRLAVLEQMAVAPAPGTDSAGGAWPSVAASQSCLEELLRLARYERCAFSRRRRVMRAFVSQSPDSDSDRHQS